MSAAPMSHDREANGNGRTSRGSSASAMGRAPGKQLQGANRPDNLPASYSGVASMLRNGTEMGNVAGTTRDYGGIGNIPRGPQRWGASSRLSTTSSRSNHSSRAGMYHREYPPSASGHRRSSGRDFNVTPFVPDTVSPTMMNFSGPSPHVPDRGRQPNEHRSRSMTDTTNPTYQLSSNRSLSSLRSEHGRQPRVPRSYRSRPRSPSPPGSYEPYELRSSRGRGRGSQEQPNFANERNGAPGYMYNQPHIASSHGQLHLGGQLSRNRALPFDQGQQRFRAPSDSHIGQSVRPDGMSHHSRRGSSPVQFSATPGSGIPPVPRIPEQYAHPTQHRGGLQPQQHYCASEQPRLSNRGSPSSGSTHLRTDRGTPSSDMTFPPTPRHGMSTEGLAGQRPGPMVDNGMQAFSNASSPIELRSHKHNGHFEREHYSQNMTNVMRKRTEVQVQVQVDNTMQSPPVKPVSGVANSVMTKRPSETGLQDHHLNRIQIRQALEVSSTPGDMETMNRSPAFVNESSITPLDDMPPVSHYHRSPASHDPPSEVRDGQERHLSTQSQTTSSAFDSSTMNIAVKYPEATVTDTGFEHQAMSNIDSKAVSLAGPGQSTEDNMSELLAGYQHTEPKVETGTTRESSFDTKKIRFADEAKNREMLKLHKRSLHRRSSGPLVDTSRDHESGISRPGLIPRKPYELSSSNFADSATMYNRPAAHGPLASESSVLHRTTPSYPPPQPNRTIEQEDSARSSMSSHPRASGWIPSIMPPSYSDPQRKSSALKENRKLNSVSSFLPFVVKGLKKAKKEKALPPDEEIAETGDDMRSTADSTNSISASMLASRSVKTPEKAHGRKTDVSKEACGTQISPDRDSSSKILGVSINPVAVYHSSLSNPSLIAQEPSSVYSILDSSHVLPLDPGCRDNAQEEMTSNLRLATYRHQTMPEYLPALKEESHEDSSLNTSASNLKNSRFRLGPSGRLSLGACADEAMTFPRSSVGSHACNALGGIKIQSPNLPSMEFSRTNLMERVNNELSSDYPDLSEEELTRLLDPEVLVSVVQRAPAAAEASPAQCDTLPEETEAALRGSDQVLEPSKAMSPMAAKQSPLSRKTTTATAAEIEEFRIPSCGNFGEQIYKLMSSLKRPKEEDEEDKIMDYAMEEIQKVGGPVQKRSSARLRPVPGSPTMMVVDDAVYEELTSKDKENNAFNHPGNRAGKLSAGEAASAIKNKSVISTPTKTLSQSPHTAPDTPQPAATRRRALTQSDQHLRALLENPPRSPRSLRSVESDVPTPTVTDTRPWNFDKNYPWVKNNPFINISLTQPTNIEHSSHFDPRGTFSDASKASSFSSADTATASPFGTTATSNAPAFQGRFRSFGRSTDQHHAAGERYPTSALTPPTAIFRDHSSAFDTSDDEDFNPSRKHKLSLRKHFTSTRNAHRRKAGPAELASPESAEQFTDSDCQDRANQHQGFAAKRLTFRNAEGMRSASYYRKKIVFEVSLFWNKTKNFFRKLTHNDDSSENN